MRDFVAAWDKVMNNDRFDLGRTVWGREGPRPALRFVTIALQQARATLCGSPALAVDRVCAESPGYEHIVMERRRPGPGLRQSLHRQPGAPLRKISRRRMSHGEKHRQKDQAA